MSNLDPDLSPSMYGVNSADKESLSAKSRKRNQKVSELTTKLVNEMTASDRERLDSSSDKSIGQWVMDGLKTICGISPRRKAGG